MKKSRLILFISLFLWYPFLDTCATAASSDILIVNNVQWALMDKPIACLDSVSYARFMNFLPKERSWNTSNWEGYTAYWTIKNKRLYLLKVEVEMYDKEKGESHSITFEADTLRNVFASYYTKHGISAQWFSRKVRAGRGELIRYVHGGFDRNMEEEYVMTIKKGKVLEKKLWHNSKKKGLNLNGVVPEVIKRFPFDLFPEIKGKRLIFSLAHFDMLADGHLVNCEVSVCLPDTREWVKDQNHPLVKACKDVLKSIYPWEILHINGKYTLEFERFTFPLREKTN